MSWKKCLFLKFVVLWLSLALLGKQSLPCFSLSSFVLPCPRLFSRDRVGQRWLSCIVCFCLPVSGSSAGRSWCPHKIDFTASLRLSRLTVRRQAMCTVLSCYFTFCVLFSQWGLFVILAILLHCIWFILYSFTHPDPSLSVVIYFFLFTK